VPNKTHKVTDFSTNLAFLKLANYKIIFTFYNIKHLSDTYIIIPRIRHT